MFPKQRTYFLTCEFCGHSSHIILSSESHLDEMTVSCPACGKAAGTLDGSETEVPEEPVAVEDERPRRRAMSLEVIERRSAAAIVRPYLSRISTWQLRSAYLRAKLTSHGSGDDDALAIQLELGRMRKDLRSTVDALHASIHDVAPPSRVRDVSLALVRLDEQLLGLLAMASAAPHHSVQERREASNRRRLAGPTTRPREAAATAGPLRRARPMR